MKPHIDPLKNEYENRSQEPSNDLWQRLEQRLDEEPKKKATIVWWQYAAAAVLLIGGMWFFTWENNVEREQHLQTVSVEKPSEITSQQPEVSPLKIDSKPESLIVSSDTPKPNLENKTPIPQQHQENKNEDVAISVEPTSSNEQPIAENIQPLKTQSYTTASDLLFGAEIQREKNKTSDNKNPMGQLEIPQIKKPKEINVLGVRVYSNDSGDSQ